MVNPNANKRDLCSGCTACMQSCTTQCITMKKDKMGFLYPSVDQAKCVNCGACDRACHSLNERLPKNTAPLEVYASKGLDENVRLISSSGGLFSLIAQYVISQNGVVFGATFSDDFHTVRHIAVESLDKLPSLYGSKYVQSDIKSSYKDAKAYLQEGRMVLFSGTPCQIAGLRSFLAKDYENLILLDIVCHGAPAPAVWDEYLGYLEKKYSGKATAVSFRDKRESWRDYVLSIKFDNGKEYVQNRANDLYMRGFLHDHYLRPSCFNCKNKGVDRIADITLGDLWGAEKIAPKLDDNKGTSLVIISSEKGKLIFDKIAPSIDCQPVELDDAVKYNSAVVKSVQSNSVSNQFESSFQTKPINQLLRKYCSRPLHRKIAQKIKLIIKR